jgi:hypothetical protein
VRVAQRMKAEAFEASFLHQFHDTRSGAVRAVVSALQTAEHELTILILPTQERFVSILFGAMFPQRIPARPQGL